jgi:hypothetical protein
MTQKEFKHYIELTIRIAKASPELPDEKFSDDIFDLYKQRQIDTAFRWCMIGMFVASILQIILN